MKIQATQKVIKIGSSLAVTIPAKDAQRFAIKAGEDLDVSFQRPEVELDHAREVVEITQKLIARHEQALKNLSQR